MTYNKKSALWLILIWMMLILLSFVLESCRTERIAIVPEYHEVVVHQRDTVSCVDSIYVQDSTLVLKQHDTIFITRMRVMFRDRWRDRLRVDSFIQCDTLTVVKEVEKPPSRWQKLSMRVGNAVLLLLLLAVVGGGVWLLLRLRFRR